MPQGTRDFSSEVVFRATRSGGKGGQHVNKVSTRAEAWWHVSASAFFSPDEKELIMGRLNGRINKEGFLIVRSSETRSLLENRLIAERRLRELVAGALFIPPERKPTRPTKASRQRRLDSKRIHSLKKQNRRPDL